MVCDASEKVSWSFVMSEGFDDKCIVLFVDLKAQYADLLGQYKGQIRCLVPGTGKLVSKKSPYLFPMSVIHGWFVRGKRTILTDINKILPSVDLESEGYGELRLRFISAFVLRNLYFEGQVAENFKTWEGIARDLINIKIENPPIKYTSNLSLSRKEIDTRKRWGRKGRDGVSDEGQTLQIFEKRITNALHESLVQEGHAHVWPGELGSLVKVVEEASGRRFGW